MLKVFIVVRVDVRSDACKSLVCRSRVVPELYS